MAITTEKNNQQPKKDYQSPTLTNQGKLEQQTQSGGAIPSGDLAFSS